VPIEIAGDEGVGRHRAEGLVIRKACLLDSSILHAFQSSEEAETEEKFTQSACLLLLRRWCAISKENLGHHSFVFMLQKMAVKQGNAADDWISEIHDHVHRTSRLDVDRVEPLGGTGWDGVCRVHLEVNLVNMKRVNLAAAIYHGPVMKCADRNRDHWRCIWLILAAIDVEAVLVLGEYHGEIRSALLQGIKLRGGDRTMDR
jgi:hypothetical protein